MKKLLLVLFVSFTVLAKAQVFWPTTEPEVIENLGSYTLSKVVSADLNNDGTDEIIYYKYFSTTKTITIHDPSSGTSLDIATSSGAGKFKFGDFNEDGFLDIIHDASVVYVYLSDDSKSFLASGFYAGSALAPGSTAVAVGDIDENGDLDVLVAAFGPHKWVVYNGDGLGGFTETNLGLPTSWSAASGTYTASIELIDFDGDDNLDIIASGKTFPSPASKYGTTISKGDGSGAFNFASDYLSTIDVAANKPIFYGDGDEVLITDVDGDSEPDIIFQGAFGNGSKILLNNGVAIPTFTDLGFSLGSDFMLADFNGDLEMDIVNASNNGHYDIMLSDGNGSFSYDRSFATGSNQGSTFTMADANGDSEKDIVYSDGIEDILYLATFDNGYKSYNGLVGEYNLRDETYYDAELSDLDGDGYDEMLTLHNDSLVVMMNNDMQWSFAAADYYITPDNPKAIEVVDLTNDGYPEVIVGSADATNTNITVFTNDNSGNLSFGTQFTSGNIADITSGDLNGNGAPDIIAVTNSDILVMLNNGTGTLASPISTSFSSGNFVSTGDINGDGFLDVIVKRSSRVYAYLGDGSGGLTASGQNDFINDLGNESLRVADFNNDGIDDIVSIKSSFSNYQINVALGEAGKLLSELTVVLSGSFFNPVDFNIGDFNGDGNLDVVLDSDHSKEMRTFLGDGTGSFVEPMPAIKISSVSSDNNVHIAVGDINFNDKTDVVIVRQSEAYVLLNVFTQATEPTVSASNLSIGTPDFNGTDISWDRGNGDAVMVLIAENTIDLTKLPVDFSISNDLGGNSILYDGTGASVTSGVLKKNTMYEVGVIEYNGSTVSANYFTSGFPTASFTTPKSAQTITFNYSADVAYTQNPYAGIATASSGLDITYEVVSGPAEITTEGLIQLTGIGAVTLRAKQEGNNEYDPAPDVEQTFTVIQGQQTISFNLSATTYINYDNYELPIYSSGGLPISYSLDSGPGSLVTDGDTTWYVWDGEGSITITATQAGSTEFSAAVPVIRASTISKRDQTITWNRSEVIQNKNNRLIYLEGESIQMTLDTLQLNAVSSSGLPVTYIIFSGPGYLEGINEDSRNYIYNGVGDVTINAFASGDDVYNSTFPADVNFTVIKGDQTISHNAQINGIGLSSYAYDPEVWVKINGNSTSGLAIDYSLANTDLATIVADSVNVTSVGSISLRLNQAGDDNWNAAAEVQVNWAVSRANQVVIFDDIYENMVVKDSVIVLEASNDSGLDILYDISRNPSSSDVSINGNSLTVNSTSRSGSIQIRAYSQANVNYNQSDPVLVDFCLLPETPSITVSGLGSSAVTLTSSNTWDYAEWEKDGSEFSSFAGNFQPTITSQDQVGTYKVRARSHDGECPVSDWSNEASLLITGLGELSNQLSIYPNPAESIVFVTLPTEANANLDVYATDMNGRTIRLNYEIESTKQLSLDISHLTKGNYLLHLRKGEQVFYQKLNKK